MHVYILQYSTNSSIHINLTIGPVFTIIPSVVPFNGNARIRGVKMADDKDKDQALVVLSSDGVSFHGAGTKEAKLMSGITNGDVEPTETVMQELIDLVAAGVASARKVFRGISVKGGGQTIWQQRRDARREGGSGQLPN